MAAPKTSNLPPFTPVDLRAWVEGNTDERDVVGAIRLLQWLEGPDAEIYLAMIVAACFPTSERQIKRALASTKTKGWVISSRSAKGRMGRGAPTYALAIKPMAFKEARLILDQRANLAPRLPLPTGQESTTNGPDSTDQEARVAPRNNKEKDLQERPTTKIETAPKGATMPPHPEQDFFWNRAKATWAASPKAQGQPLQWPRLNGFPKALYAALESLGGIELERRWCNMVYDPYARPSLMALVTEPDKWVNVRTAGNATARPFHNPKPVDAFKPAPTLGEKGHP